MHLVLICKISLLKSLYLQTKIQWLETSYCPFYFISLTITNVFEKMLIIMSIKWLIPQLKDKYNYFGKYCNYNDNLKS